MSSAPTKDTVLINRLYKTLSLIRKTEEQVAQVYPSDKIKSPIHLAIGQEFICTAICDHLSAQDYIAATYRGHGAFLAKGGSLKSMVAEMYGKRSGCAKGRGGSMHLISKDARVIGTSAVVATGIPVAVGHAMAIKKQKRKNEIVVCFFGDGATEEGCFLESVNFAALHKLPILFVCENNFFAIHEPLEKRWATKDLCERVSTFGIEARCFKEPDIMALHTFAGTAIHKIKQGLGPVFIESYAYRWREHVGPNEDYDQGYRAENDVKVWKEKDQFEALGCLLQAEERRSIDLENDQAIKDAFLFAENEPFPLAEELYEHNYAE